eukprot:GHVR01051601.1.p1 GENE.GHVR01051601.1~~GHVR01051601.1.p1  ORF type:complete len:167 (+),score=45.63 GHVR01051601.1:124-624(+)
MNSIPMSIPPPMPISQEYKKKDNDSDVTMKDNDSDINNNDKMNDTDTVSVEERLTLALSCKDAGNIHFKNQENEQAITLYRDGIKHIKSLPNDTHGLKEITVSLHSNLAFACIKLDRWFQASEAASEVLKLEPTNVKALYRRGVARVGFGSLEEAREDLVQVGDLF